jgi:hypothetical protein
MRLANRILAAVDDRRLGKFTRDLAAFTSKEIKAAQRFTVTDDVHDATRQLITSRPSSLLEALLYARPPFNKTWIEWPTPNQPPPIADIRVRTTNIGVLIDTMPGSKGAAWEFWTAWSYDTTSELTARTGKLMGVEIPDDFTSGGFGVASVAMAFDYGAVLSEPHHCQGPQWVAPLPQTVEQMAAKRDDRFNSIRYALQSESERAALNRIITSFRWRPRTDQMSMLQTQVSLSMGAQGREALLDDVRDEMGPLLGLLIMLNARNCVARTVVSAPQRLNKARIKRGKPPLLDHTSVDIRLSPSQERVAHAQGLTQAERRRHIVRGHFKIRRTGVFWWSAHLAGKGKQLQHDYTLRP